MRTTRSLAVLATASLALLVSGCSAFPGPEAEEEFVEHFTATYPEHVVDTQTESAGKMPFTGADMEGSLTLADDTSPEMFATILDDLVTWEPEAGGVRYEPVGVVANGVGVCVGDEQQDQMQSLRDALYAEGLALQGSWPCPEPIYSRHFTYRGSLADVTRDAEVVKRLWDGTGDLRLRAEVSPPFGTIDHAWADVPDTLEATIEAVAAEEELIRFELTDEGLRIAVKPTVDLGPAQEAAAAAAGPDLSVELMQGSLNADHAAEMGSRAHILDALGPVEGVTSVSINEAGAITLTTDEPQAVRGIYDAAMEHPEFDEDLRLQIVVNLPDVDGTAQNHFVRFPGGDDELLPLFDDLLASEHVTRAWISSPLPDIDPDNPPPARPTVPGVRITVAGPVVETVPELRDILPDGLRLSLTNSEDHRDSVNLVTAPTLTAEDVDSVFTIPDLEAIAEAWNAAG